MPIGSDADAQTHLDRCLGCRAVRNACPSGVPYGHLLEATRERLVARRPLPVVDGALSLATIPTDRGSSR